MRMATAWLVVRVACSADSNHVSMAAGGSTSISALRKFFARTSGNALAAVDG